MVQHDLEITLEERDFALKDLGFQEKQLRKQTRRVPLTLLRQKSLASDVGFGNVNFEAKRLGEVKKKSRREGLSILRDARTTLLKRKIKGQPDPIIPDLSSFNLDINMGI